MDGWMDADSLWEDKRLFLTGVSRTWSRANFPVSDVSHYHRPIVQSVACFKLESMYFLLSHEYDRILSPLKEARTSSLLFSDYSHSAECFLEC
jgi:hypothetical protein